MNRILSRRRFLQACAAGTTCTMLGRLSLFGDTAAVSPASQPAAPAAPKEFAFTLSPGYGTKDHFSNVPAEFENLLVNMKKSGFNTIHCVYRDWRAELCRKHGVRMMIDVLAWGEGAGTDIRRPEQRPQVRAICEKVRGDDAVWGYNLWNETMSYFGRPDGKGIDDYIAMLKRWDPTHPVWVGTYRVSGANGPRQRPGVHGYYDYAWQRGFLWHYADLQWFQGYVPSQDGCIGRWVQGSNYNGDSFTLNTSLAFGLKVVIWFIGGPFDKQGNVDEKHRFRHLIRIGQEMQTLYPELGKIGRPGAVYSTPTTKTHDNKDKNRDVPWRLKPFPEDFWFRVAQGEAVAGFFAYPTGEDAVFVANHNAYAPQRMTVEIAESARGERTAVELFDRSAGQWKRLDLKDGRCSFDLREAGGELLRVTGRVKPAPTK